MPLRPGGARAAEDAQGTSTAVLVSAVNEALLGLGDRVHGIQRKQYRAYQRLRNLACQGQGALDDPFGQFGVLLP